jgi:CCR4-NOT transcriptional regulation complex NOT5 subunit
MFPEKVLFYIFYNLPYERAQMTAANELKSRRWSYSKSIMRWIKVPQVKTKKSHGRKSPSSNKSVTVFNPETWSEEEIAVQED